MKKRVLPIFVALVLIVSCVCGLTMTANAAAELQYAMPVAQDGIAVDGDLSDWANAEKYALSSYDKTSSAWAASEYSVQVAASPESIYLALTVPDAEKTVDGLIRDQLRIFLITPEGKMGIMYTDSDKWNLVDPSIAGWWGITNTITENAIIASNSHSAFVYNGDGTVTVEARICVSGTTAALKVGDEFQLGVQYYNHQQCNSKDYAGDGLYAMGAAANITDISTDLTATFKIGEKPVQEIFNYEATAPVGGAEMDIIEGVSTDFETDFWEWEDEEDGLWEAAPKYPLDVYDPATGMYVKSETEYVQFKFVYGQLYFRIHAKDADGKSANGLIRDGVHITMILPGGEEGHFFLGTDARDSVVWKEWGVYSWFDSTVESEVAKENNAFTNNNATACFYYADGYADVEGRVTVKDQYTHYFAGNTQLKVGIVYRDNTKVTAVNKEGGNWAKWGTTDPTNHDVAQVSGLVTLDDPNFRDLDGVKLEEPTAGAENDTYCFDADGNLLVYVKETAGAAAYRVRLFNMFDAPVTWEESDNVKMVVSRLTAGDVMTYQVVALNDVGEIIAVYPAVEFEVGVDPVPEATEPEATEPEATEPEATEPEATEPEATEPTDNPSKTGNVALSAVVGLMAIATICGGIMIAKKNNF